MESGHAVTNLEVLDALAERGDGACYVVAGVVCAELWDLGDLPVFWVGAGDGDLDQDLVWSRLWDVDLLDLDALG